MTQQDDENGCDIISIYTRRQALADGLQHDVSKIASEAGLNCPTFITDGVLAQCVKIPPGVECQDEAGRLWDVVWMMVVAIRRTQPQSDWLTYQLYVRDANDGEPSLVTLKAVCGPLDFDDPQPAMTIMLPDED